MKMRFVSCVTFAAVLASAAALPDVPTVPAQMVITVQPAQKGGNIPGTLGRGDVTVLSNKTTARVGGLQRLPADLSDLQLFIYLDDSTRSSSLGVHLNELKKFVNALPGSAQVAVGYMRNGTFALAQGFTTD